MGWRCKGVCAVNGDKMKKECGEYVNHAKDYTRWQMDYFDRKSPEEFHNEAVQYAKEHPYQGKAKVIL